MGRSWAFLERLWAFLGVLGRFLGFLGAFLVALGVSGDDFGRILEPFFDDCSRVLGALARARLFLKTSKKPRKNNGFSKIFQSRRLNRNQNKGKNQDEICVRRLVET